MKKNLLTLIILVSSLNCIANLDSLLKAIVRVDRPYLILTIPSTDCATCHDPCFEILHKLSATVDNKKIVILSDDTCMEEYFDKFGSLFNKHPIIYNKYLSNLISADKHSKATIVTMPQSPGTFSMSIIDFNIIRLFDEVINYKKIIYKLKDYKFRDTVFNANSIVTYGANYFGLFNEQFQVGLFYNKLNDKHFQEQPLWNDITIQKLYGQLRLYGMKNLADEQIRKQSLMMTGTTECVIGNVDAKSGSLLFKLYSVTATTENRAVGDTLFDLWPKIFLATNKNKSKNVLDVNAYSTYTLFDSIHHNKNVLQPLGTQYEVYNSHVLMAYSDLEHNKTRKIDRHDIQFLSNVEIADFIIDNKNVAQMRHVYEVDEGDNGPGDFFFRVSDKGMPIVVSETNKRINFLQQNVVVYFKELAYGPGDTVDKVYDVKVHSDTLEFAAHSMKNHFLFGTYNTREKSLTFRQIKTETGHDDMKINNNNFLGFKKDMDYDQVIFNEYSLSPQ